MEDKGYSFKRFVGTGTRYEDRITVTKSKTIGLPTFFYKKNKIDSYGYAVLFLDEGLMAIAISFSKNKVPGAFKLAKTLEYGASINAQSFFTANSIDTKQFAGRYHYLTMDNSEIGNEQPGKAFVIELRNNNQDKAPMSTK